MTLDAQAITVEFDPTYVHSIPINPMAAELIAGETGPDLMFSLQRRGQPIDLTGGTVTATVNRPGTTDLTKTLAVQTPNTGGQALLSWASGDLVAPSGVTQYNIDLQVTVSGEVETQPLPVMISVRPPVP
jgi:hypothetical protein